MKIVNGEYSVNIPSALLLRSSPWLSHLLNRYSCPALFYPKTSSSQFLKVKIVLIGIDKNDVPLETKCVLLHLLLKGVADLTG